MTQEVLHAAGNFKLEQAADILKIDQNIVQAAISAEDDNISRILRSYYNGANDADCANVIKDFLEQENTVALPAHIDEKGTGIIDSISASLERKKRKRIISVSAIVAIFCLGIVIIITLGSQSGGSIANGGADTSLISVSVDNTIDSGEDNTISKAIQIPEMQTL